MATINVGVVRRAWLILTIVSLAGACGDGDKDSTSTASTPSSDTGASTPVDTSDACALLTPADFATVGVTVDDEGVDVSENFSLSTTSSVACQWTNFDNNVGGSWELVIGTGDAKAAFEFDLGFAEIDSVTRPDLGDDAFLVDKVSSLDSADHDFEAGVRIGDIYFTMSTTDDHGSDAIAALAALVADRLT